MLEITPSLRYSSICDVLCPGLSVSIEITDFVMSLFGMYC